MFHEGKFPQRSVPEYHRKVKACYSNKSYRNVCHGNSYLEQNVSDIFETLELCDLSRYHTCHIRDCIL